MTKLFLSILDSLNVRHTDAFVRKMCNDNIQGYNLFGIIALVFLLCGAYRSLLTLNIFDIAGALLLWGTLLTLIIKVITPAVENRHDAEAAKASLVRIKGKKDVQKAILGEQPVGVRDIVIAVSPSCPFCKTATRTIEDILMPAGRFSVEKKYKAIHPGDDRKIEALIGGEEAQRQALWCDEHEVNATPTIFFNGKKLDPVYSVEDLLYI